MVKSAEKPPYFPYAPPYFPYAPPYFPYAPPYFPYAPPYFSNDLPILVTLFFQLPIISIKVLEKSYL